MLYICFFFVSAIEKKNSDAFLSLSSALTVLKQEIPSPFGTEQIKKLPKTTLQVLSKVRYIGESGDKINQNQKHIRTMTVYSRSMQDSSDEGSSKEQQSNALNKGSSNAVTIVNVANTAANINCQLNGNGDNSNPGDLVNCLDSIAQNQQQTNQNDSNVDRNDVNKLSKDIDISFSFMNYILSRIDMSSIYANIQFSFCFILNHVLFFLVFSFNSYRGKQRPSERRTNC